MQHRTRLSFAAVLTVPLVLTACGDGSEPSETVEETVTQTVTPPAPEPTDSPSDDEADDDSGGDDESGVDESPVPGEDPPSEEAPFPANRLPDTREPSADARLSPTDVRFGLHEGYDRVVLDLSGPGLPGWRAEYVEEPTQQGSGNPVELEGGAALAISVTGVVYPTEEGAEDYGGPERFAPATAEIVEEVVVGGIFEGHQEIFVGLDSEQPFRVFGLEDPTRVVIDVQHP